MFIFKPGDFFFQKIHPIALIIYILTLFSITIISNHPVILCTVLIITVLSVISVGAVGDIKDSFAFILRMTLIFIIINCLTNKNGRTIIWRGPNIPVFGRLQISLEALIYALMMGIRLSGVLSVFILQNKSMNPDALLSYMALIFPRSALLVSMTTKTIPYLAQLSNRVGEVMSVMGLDIDGKGYKGTVKNRLPIIKVIFMSSIEDSLSIAESIQARGYGSGGRSRYFTYRWRMRDTVVLASSIWAIISFIILARSGGIFYRYYPRLGKIVSFKQNIHVYINLLIGLSIPAFMGWGWRYCRYLKYRI
ncbi:energy-coupling factor transporter transmembrane component T [Xylanivirga thermophila]|uniref:energy-coupling factor transporter transmembrane component T n=1 Tax=Xylanivirga thermophila TaxID=2496273 RepID=UPI00101D1438|nr:energy-coupling factor transporter transmembrane component T [Xylanivirga thermophila]